MTTYEAVEDLPEAPLALIPSEGNRTSVWRTQRPIIDLEACTRCYLCWKFCPDVAVAIDEAGWPVVRYDYCKGCGICAEECVPRAIVMAMEGGP